MRFVLWPVVEGGSGTIAGPFPSQVLSDETGTMLDFTVFSGTMEMGLLGGLPAYHFSAAEEIRTSGFALAATDCSCVFVLAAGAQGGVAGVMSAQTPTWQAAIQNTDDMNFLQGAIHMGKTAAAGAVHGWRATTAGNCVGYRNAAQTDSDTTTGIFSATVIKLGAAVSSTLFLDGEIAFMAVWNKKLTDSEMVAIHNQLRAIYGV